MCLCQGCSHRGGRRAFTLIELLVVIAIIAILAAILFPVFAKAREKARQSSCLSNSKQVGLAYMQYAQDYDGWVPGFLNGATAVYRWAWTDVIAPYVKNSQVFVCPSTKWNVAPNRYATSSSNATDYWGFNTALYTVPAEKFMIGDTTGDTSRGCMVYSAYDTTAAAGSWAKCRGHIAPVHNEMANIAFCDGHSKAVKPSGDNLGDTTASLNRYWLGDKE